MYLIAALMFLVTGVLGFVGDNRATALVNQGGDGEYAIGGTEEPGHSAG